MANDTWGRILDGSVTSRSENHMRYAFVLTAATLFAPAALRAADPAPLPPITFQTQPVNRVLDDLRAAADLIGGEKAVKALNNGLKEKFGDKVFHGLDLQRPVVGYVTLAPKPEDIVAVVAFPVTNEKDFLALCERFSGGAPKDLGKGIYELPPLDPRHKALMRFSEQYAYIAYGHKPEAALDAKTLVAANKLYDPAEQAIFTGKFHFDRLTPDVVKALPAYVEALKKALGLGGEGRGPLGIGQQETAIFAPLVEGVEKMLTRYAFLLSGGETAAVRLNLDVPTGELSVEATVKGKPNTLLSTAIAAHKPTGNKFGGLLTPDTAAGFKTRLPFFNEELKTGTVKALEEGQKAVGPVGNAKDFVDELLKGLIRTAKTGEADVVGGVRGPDKDGDFTLVAAVAFDDTAALEKEFKKFVEADAPPDEQERFKWSADKLGKVNIHTYKPRGGGGFLDFTKPFGDDKCAVAFAFAPTGVFVVVGPDPVPVMKGALAVKPADAPVLDVLVNPARVKKLVEKTGGPGDNVERALGKEDKLLSAMSLTVSGGKELKVRYAINLRLLPRALAADGFDGDKSAVEPIPGEKK